MAKNYFNRYVWLVDLISRHGYITMQEISRAWQRSSLNDDGSPMPERTFFNHKNAIQETFGIEIKCNRDSGYYIADPSSVSGENAKVWMLQSISLNNILEESSDMKSRILLERMPSCQRFLTDIISAMREGRTIFLTYQNFTDQQPRTFEVEPYCVKLFKQRWYMLGKEGEKLNHYSLDRFVDMELSEHLFELPEDFDAEQYFSKFYGIITAEGHGAVDVRLRVDASQVPYFRSLPLHYTQTEEETTDKYSVFYYALVPMYDFMQEILSKGETVEVLEPDWLRKWAADTVKKMNERYEIGRPTSSNS